MYGLLEFVWVLWRFRQDLEIWVQGRGPWGCRGLRCAGSVLCHTYLWPEAECCFGLGLGLGMCLLDLGVRDS